MINITLSDLLKNFQNLSLRLVRWEPKSRKPGFLLLAGLLIIGSAIRRLDAAILGFAVVHSRAEDKTKTIFVLETNVRTILITLEIWSGLLGINGLYSQVVEAPQAGLSRHTRLALALMYDNSYIGLLCNTFEWLVGLASIIPAVRYCFRLEREKENSKRVERGAGFASDCTMRSKSTEIYRLEQMR